MEIQKCDFCHRAEIDWRPLEDEDDEPAYICTNCIDQQRLMRLRDSFVTLHRQLLIGLPPYFPQELFGYIYRVNYRQWLYFNGCKRSQRIQTLRKLLCGAPWTTNLIYDLHQRLQDQIDMGYR